MHDELTEVAETKRQRFNLLSNIWHHDLANRLRMRRQSDARAMGLGDDYPIGTYPSTPAPIVQMPQGGLLRAVALGALLMLGGGGATAWMGGAFKEAPAAIAKPTDGPEVSGEQTPQEFVLEIISTEGGLSVRPVED